MATAMENEEGSQGSWAPAVIVLIVLILRWLVTSQGNIAVQLRRHFQMQVSSVKGVLVCVILEIVGSTSTSPRTVRVHNIASALHYWQIYC